MRRVARFGQLASAVISLVSLIGGAAVACPRGSFCPDLAMAPTPSADSHACCAGGRRGAAPERGREQKGERCPGSCCQVSSELPQELDGIAAPTAPAMSATLAVVETAVWQHARTEPPPAIDSGPSLRDPVPPYLLGAAFLV